MNGGFRELTVGGGDRELETGLKDVLPWTGGHWLALKGLQIMVFDEHEGITSYDSEMDSARVQALNKQVLLWDPAMLTVRLLDEHMKLMSGFPLMGEGPAVLYDVNGDGSQDLILRDGPDSITMYSLQ